MFKKVNIGTNSLTTILGLIHYVCFLMISLYALNLVHMNTYYMDNFTSVIDMY